MTTQLPPLARQQGQGGHSQQLQTSFISPQIPLQQQQQQQQQQQGSAKGTATKRLHNNNNNTHSQSTTALKVDPNTNTNTNTNANTNANAATTAAIPTSSALEVPSLDSSIRRTVCLEMLISGNVGSFVELYDLSEKSPHVQNSEADLRLLQLELTNAEKAERVGNSTECFMARKRLAESFQTNGSEALSQHFWDSCVSYSKGLGDGGAQLAETYRAIGLKQEEEANLLEACKAFENMDKIAEQGNLTDLHQAASRAIARVRTAIAAQYFGQGDFVAAREQLSVASAKAASSGSSEQICNVAYYQGIVDEALGDIASAITQLELYMGTPTKEPQTLHNACMVLGRCHQARGDRVMAMQYYRRLAEVAPDSGNASATADACMRLGHLLSAEGDHVGAIEWFMKAHHHALQTTESSLQTAVRVTCGIARAKALLAGYTKTLGNTGLDALFQLLDWKNSRNDTFSSGHIIFDMALPDSGLPPTAAPTTTTAAAPPLLRTGDGGSDHTIITSSPSGGGLSAHDGGVNGGRVSSGRVGGGSGSGGGETNGDGNNGNLGITQSSIIIEEEEDRDAKVATTLQRGLTLAGIDENNSSSSDHPHHQNEDSSSNNNNGTNHATEAHSNNTNEHGGDD